MPAAMDRLDTERQFHDQQAGRRQETFRQAPHALFVDPEAYFDHETWIRPAFKQLGDVAGRQVLDFGCGHGMAAVVLARHGARVTAFDLSSGYLAEAGRRAEANDVKIALVQADGDRLPFADASFDRIWGNAILHHLDIPRAGPELRRVLRPGGVAVFCEPWGGNPLLNLARRRLLYAGKERTAGEEPLRRRDLAELRKTFSRVEVRGFQLLSMIRRVLPPGRLVRLLERWDECVLRLLPLAHGFCRYVVLTLRP